MIEMTQRQYDKMLSLLDSRLVAYKQTIRRNKEYPMPLQPYYFSRIKARGIRVDDDIKEIFEIVADERKQLFFGGKMQNARIID